MGCLSISTEYPYTQRSIQIQLNNDKNDFIDYNTEEEQQNEVIYDPAKDPDLVVPVYRPKIACTSDDENMQVEANGNENFLIQQADFDYGSEMQYAKPQNERSGKYLLLETTDRENMSTGDYDSSDSPQSQDQKSMEKMQPGSPTLHYMAVCQNLELEPLSNTYECPQQDQINIKISKKTLPPVTSINDSTFSDRSRKKRKTETPAKKARGSADKKTAKKRDYVEYNEEPEKIAPFFLEEGLEDWSEMFSQLQHETLFPNRQSSSSDSQSDSVIFPEEPRNKKSAQNRRRNGPGLIVMRSRASQIEFLSLLEQSLHNNFASDSIEFRRVRYIGQVIQKYNLTAQQFNEYKNFVRTFQVQRKTWKNVQENLGKYRLYASIFVSCTIALLSPIGENDFDAWMKQGDMSSGKITLREDREWFKVQFSSKFSDLDLLEI